MRWEQALAMSGGCELDPGCADAACKMCLGRQRHGCQPEKGTCKCHSCCVFCCLVVKLTVLHVAHLVVG